MVNGLEIAKQFHETYERLAPSFGYETRKDTKAFDPNSPNGQLMTAVCQEIGDRIQSNAYDLLKLTLEVVRLRAAKQRPSYDHDVGDFAGEI